MLYETEKGIIQVYEIVIRFIIDRVILNDFKESYTLRYDAETLRALSMLKTFNACAKEFFPADQLTNILIDVSTDYNLSIRIFSKMNGTIL